MHFSRSFWLRLCLRGATAVLVFVVSAPFVLAQPSVGRVPVTNVHSGRSVTIPEHAVEVAPDVFSLGLAVDPATGKVVEGYMVLDRRGADAKGGKKGKPDGGSGGGDVCYAFLANGARWKTTEDYVIDSANDDGLSDSFVERAVAGATAAWDSEVGASIFGTRVGGVVDGADEVSPDGMNEVLFAPITSPGVVGVTIVWGIFRGSPSNRELVEWDQVYDDADYDFGDAALDPTLFDFAGVAAHEVGHAAGMGHPSDGCTQETMYRFVAPGQTFQRDLHDGDIAGVVALY